MATRFRTDGGRHHRRDFLRVGAAGLLGLSEGQLGGLLAQGKRAGASARPAAPATQPIDPEVRKERDFLALCVALPAAGERALGEIELGQARSERHLIAENQRPDLIVSEHGHRVRFDSPEPGQCIMRHGYIVLPVSRRLSRPAELQSGGLHFSAAPSALDSAAVEIDPVRPPRSQMSLYAVVDPASGETVKEYPTISDDDLRAAIARADETHRTWSQSTSLHERASLVRRVAELHTERRDALGEIIVREMGKPIEQALGEVDFSAAIYEFYADNAEDIMADEPIKLLDGEGTAIVHRTSYGGLLGIMPWNYPYYQVARCAAPNLIIGNTILLKHAPQCPE